MKYTTLKLFLLGCAAPLGMRLCSNEVTERQSLLASNAKKKISPKAQLERELQEFKDIGDAEESLQNQLLIEEILARVEELDLKQDERLKQLERYSANHLKSTIGYIAAAVCLGALAALGINSRKKPPKSGTQQEKAS